MYRIDNQFASTILPTPLAPGTPGFYSSGSIGGELATIVTADAMNEIQEELVAVVNAGGLTLDKTDNTQVIQAILALIAGNTRKRLTGPLDLYCANGGSDTNNGLTPSTPFAAYNLLVQQYDLGGQTVTIHLADGNYEPIDLNGAPLGVLSPLNIVFQGNVGNPANVQINQSTALGACFSMNYFGQCILRRHAAFGAGEPSELYCRGVQRKGLCSKPGLRHRRQLPQLGIMGQPDRRRRRLHDQRRGGLPHALHQRRGGRRPAFNRIDDHYPGRHAALFERLRPSDQQRFHGIRLDDHHLGGCGHRGALSGQQSLRHLCAERHPDLFPRRHCRRRRRLDLRPLFDVSDNNRPHPKTATELAGSISERLIKVLPPAFLLLVVLNCLFLGVIAWVFDHNAETRNALLTKIVERCLVQQREPR